MWCVFRYSCLVTLNYNCILFFNRLLSLLWFLLFHLFDEMLLRLIIISLALSIADISCYNCKRILIYFSVITIQILFCSLFLGQTIVRPITEKLDESYLNRTYKIQADIRIDTPIAEQNIIWKYEVGLSNRSAFINGIIYKPFEHELVKNSENSYTSTLAVYFHNETYFTNYFVSLAIFNCPDPLGCSNC